MMALHLRKAQHRLGLWALQRAATTTANTTATKTATTNATTAAAAARSGPAAKLMEHRGIGPHPGLALPNAFVRSFSTAGEADKSKSTSSEGIKAGGKKAEGTEGTEGKGSQPQQRGSAEQPRASSSSSTSSSSSEAYDDQALSPRVPALMAIVFVVGSLASAGGLWWEMQGRSYMMSRELDKAQEQEFYQRIEELKQYYAAQGPGPKHDPDKNTALSFFISVHRGMRLLPTGIPAWKAQALESIQDWSWEALPTKGELAGRGGGGGGRGKGASA